MENPLAEWLARLEPIELPAFAHSVRELKTLAANENVRVTQLVEVIERDPGLSLRLVRRINALRRKHLRTEINTIQHALMMMGLSALQTLPEGMPTVEGLTDPSVRARIGRSYARAVHAATQARDWARFHQDLEPDESYVAALFFELSEMALALAAPDRLAEMEQLRHERADEAEESEYVTLGFGLEELGIRLLTTWGLPSLVTEALAPENAERPRVLGILLADRLARASEHYWYSAETTAVLQQVADFLPCSFGTAAARTHANSVEAARRMHVFGVPSAAALLPMPSRAEAEPGYGAAPEAAEFCLCPQPPAYDAAVTRLRAAAQGGIPLPEVLESTLKGLHEGLGLNRVLFALLASDRTEVKARASLGAEGDARFNRLRVPLGNRNLLVQMLAKPQALWLDDNNRERFAPLLPPEFVQAVEVNRFFLFSLFVRERPVGLLYGDRHTDACGLDARAYHRFKQLATRAATAMEALARK